MAPEEGLDPSDLAVLPLSARSWSGSKGSRWLRESPRSVDDRVAPGRLRCSTGSRHEPSSNPIFLRPSPAGRTESFSAGAGLRGPVRSEDALVGRSGVALARRLRCRPGSRATSGVRAEHAVLALHNYLLRQPGPVPIAAGPADDGRRPGQHLYSLPITVSQHARLSPPELSHGDQSSGSRKARSAAPPTERE